MSSKIRIHSYAHNGIKGKKPRVPMVHLLASDGYGNVQSITFHPDDAPTVAKQIIAAGNAAKAGRERKPVTITFKPHG